MTWPHLRLLFHHTSRFYSFQSCYKSFISVLVCSILYHETECFKICSLSLFRYALPPLLCLLNPFSCFRFQINCNFWETSGNFPDFIRSLFISYHTIIYFSFVANNTVALSYLLWNIIIYIHYLTMNKMK